MECMRVCTQTCVHTCVYVYLHVCMYLRVCFCACMSALGTEQITGLKPAASLAADLPHLCITFLIPHPSFTTAGPSFLFLL